MIKAIAKRLLSFTDFYNIPSNGTIADAVLHHFDLKFQVSTFSCYVFAMQKLHRQRGVALVSHCCRSFSSLSVCLCVRMCMRVCVRVCITPRTPNETNDDK